MSLGIFTHIWVVSFVLFAMSFTTEASVNQSQSDSDISMLDNISTTSQRPLLVYNVSGSNSWYPYFIANRPDAPGIISELLPKILHLAQINGKTIDLPPMRTNKALTTGLLDFDVVSPSWFANEDLGPEFVQSISIMSIAEHVVTLEKNLEQWRELDNIYGKEIGTIRGYLYHDDKQFTRFDFASEKELVRALHRGRVEAVISGDYPALYWSAQLKLPIKLAALHSQGFLVVRLRKEHQSFLPELNSAIKALKNDGVIDALIKKYTHPIEKVSASGEEIRKYD